MAIRLIQIGLGGRGHHWLDLLAKRDDVVPVGYVDADPKVCERVGPGRASRAPASSIDWSGRSARRARTPC